MSKAYCSHCEEEIKNNTYHHKNKQYCSNCYSLLFKLRQCESCNKRKRIHYLESVLICNCCRNKDKPCIRCKQVAKPIGRHTSNGPICRSCVIYFSDFKQCKRCKKRKVDVSNRKVENSTSLLCGSCYNSTLPLCINCGYRRPPFSYDFSRNPICRICSEEQRNCLDCGTNIQAGIGHYCSNCMYTKVLIRRLDSGSSTLSEHFASNFYKFGMWLQNRRGSHFSATHIQKYLPYFTELDDLAIKLGRPPYYHEVVKKITIASTRKNLLVTKFLDDEKIIKIDHSLKQDFSNINAIERYLNRYGFDSFYYAALSAYYETLSAKLKAGKTSTRSIRLALTPAIKLLDACQYFDIPTPTENILFGMLWVSPGQYSAITGFVNFLNKHYRLELKQPHQEALLITPPTMSKMLIKDRLIRLLRSPQNTCKYKNDVLIATLAYFHHISVPKYAIVTTNMIKKNSDNDYYIPLVKHHFYIPSKLQDLLLTLRHKSK